MIPTYNFVTLFDLAFAPQGLALYDSLNCNLDTFTLFVLCVDQTTYDYLSSLNRPSLIPVNLSDHITTDLSSLRQKRTHTEFCWTLTPWSLTLIFNLFPSIQLLTYIDADMYCLRSPSKLLTDFWESDKSFLVTEHSYSPFCDNTSLSGRFCVQFLSVKRSSGEIPLNDWKKRCLNYCSSKWISGRPFGDQGHLHDVYNQFAKHFYVVSDSPLFLAPWNIGYYRHSDSIFYHFHGLRTITKRLILTSRGYDIPDVAYHNIYSPYISLIKRYLATIPDVPFQLKLSPSLTIRIILSSLFQALYVGFNTIRKSATLF